MQKFALLSILFHVYFDISFSLKSLAVNAVARTPLHRIHRSVMAMTEVEAWLDCTNLPVDTFLPENFPADCILASEGQKLEMNRGSQAIRVLIDKETRITDAAGKALGAIIEVSSVAGQNKALSLVGSVEWIALRCTSNWTMIPVENLIAACDGTGTKLAVFLDSIENLPGVLFALELGPHAIILSPDTELWNAYISLQRSQSASTRQLNKSSSRMNKKQIGERISTRDKLDVATVTAISSGGIGDRVCLDLIQLLKHGEGLLIGSSSKILALVHGETFEGEYVPSRPFRVNAGPVHSYVLMADGSTKYLSEVKAGDAVKVVDASRFAVDQENGFSAPFLGRAVTVGRCKIESRPMLLIAYTHTRSVSTADSELISEKNLGQIFLQQAETVRLIAPCVEGFGLIFKAMPVTEMVVGDSIFVQRNDMGTHVGNRITANVLEK